MEKEGAANQSFYPRSWELWLQPGYVVLQEVSFFDQEGHLLGPSSRRSFTSRPYLSFEHLPIPAEDALRRIGIGG